MLGISKKGNPYLRKILVQGGMSVVARVKVSTKRADLERDLKPPEILQPIMTLEKSASESKMETTKLGSEPCHKRKKVKVTAPKLLSQNVGRVAWVTRLLKEKCAQKAAVAIANKNARIIWSLLKSGQSYDPKRGIQTNAA